MCMKTRLLPLLFILFFSFSESLAQTAKYHRISASIKPSILDTLFKQGLGVDHFGYEQDLVFTAEVSDDDIALFKKNKVKFIYLITDLEKNLEKYNATIDKLNKNKKIAGALVTTPTNFALGNYGGFYTYAQMQTILDQMRALYPNLISAKTSIGNTIENRAVYMVKISDNPDVDENEPEMFLNAVHHAREPVGMSQMIFYMWHLLENYNTNADYKNLINSTEIYFVPLVNPDGYVYNQTTNPSGGGLWRKNRKNNGNGSFGVDLNRNYGYAWGADNTGSSPTTTSDTYRGTAAFSEPETQIMRDFCNAHNFTISFDYHAYGNYLIYPYSNSSSNANPEIPLFQQMSNYLTAENGYISGNSNQTLNYVVNGGGNDWRYGEQTTKSKIYSFLPEVGSSTDGFWPASSRIIPLCNATIEMNIKGLKMATYYGKATNITSNFSNNAGTVNYSFQNFSIKPATYTVSLMPISPQITAVGTSKTYSNFSLLQNQNDNITFTVNPATPVGTVLQLQLKVNNGLDELTEIVNVTVTCTSAPTTLTTTTVTTNSATLNWAAIPGINNYTVEYKTNSSSTWIVANANNASTNFSLTGLAQNTIYNWRVKANCANGFSAYSQANFTTKNPITYCASKGSNSSIVFIDWVLLGTINRVSGNDGGYFNGTANSTNLLRGASQTIAFSSGFASTTYRQYWRVWIDYNKDGDFTDTGEQVVSTDITGSGNGLGTFVIPNSALLGTTRMRVASKNGSLPTSCQTFSYGEVEDYTVNIITPVTARKAVESLNEKTNIHLVKVSPNPVKDFINVDFGQTINENIHYTLATEVGVIVATGEINGTNESAKINSKKLKKGLYVLNLVLLGNEKKSIKILKQ